MRGVRVDWIALLAPALGLDSLVVAVVVLSHVGSGELDDFGAGDDAVEDGFCDDGDVEGSVPVFGVELAGDRGGFLALSGCEDV